MQFIRDEVQEYIKNLEKTVTFLLSYPVLTSPIAVYWSKQL